MKKIAFAVTAAVLLASCSSAQSGSGAPLAPNPPAPAETSSVATPTSTPTPTPTPTGPAKNARGNTIKEIGETASLIAEDNNTKLIEFKVTSIEPNFKCNGDYPEESKNGLFVAVGLEIVTSSEYEEYMMSFTPYDFAIVSPEGKTENDSVGNAYACLKESDSLPVSIGPGEHVVGKVVLDTAHASGGLVLKLIGNPGGWEWVYA